MKELKRKIEPMTDQVILINKFKRLGFEFTQSEFCTKGKMTVILDMFPYLFEVGDGTSHLFETYVEFYSLYKKYS